MPFRAASSKDKSFALIRKKIIYYTGLDQKKQAAFFIGSYATIYLRQSLEDVYRFILVGSI